MLISEAFDLYRNDYMLFKGQSKRILETHNRVKRTLIYSIGDKCVNTLTLEDIGKWRKDSLKNRCLNTYRNDVARLRMVLKYLQLRDIICLKPELIPLPKRIDTIPDFLLPEEVDAMIKNSHCLRNAFIISLLYSSGIRLSEFISLNRGQIQNRRFTVIGKGGKARLCFIDHRTENLMTQYMKNREDLNPALVISHLNRDRMTATNVQLLIKNSARRAGIQKKVTPHTLRHSFATNFLQNNGNIRYCQQLLGHASIETTMIYTHVTDTDLETQYKKFHTI